ncbi:MAG: transposase [Candidatus Binataceae bacterium]
MERYRIKEGKQAVAMTRLSCHRFRANEARLWLSLIAYNLGNLWRRLALPKVIANWSLTSLQQRVVMIVSNCTSCSDVLGSVFATL